MGWLSQEELYYNIISKLQQIAFNVVLNLRLVNLFCVVTAATRELFWHNYTLRRP